MDIAIYGGSFNPPHVAHAMVASWLLWTEQVQEVWLVPVFRHAFEGIQEKTLARYEVRLQWCRELSADVHGRIRVSDIESKLPPPSYTIDTLKALDSLHVSSRFRLVIGADVLAQLHLWKDWKGIEKSYAPIIVGRGGYDLPGALPFPTVSSSGIRESLGRGEVPSHLLTSSVTKCLEAENPYLI
jgi:nicotinate-nucleotide adenylyltransferase